MRQFWQLLVRVQLGEGCRSDRRCKTLPISVCRVEQCFEHGAGVVVETASD